MPKWTVLANNVDCWVDQEIAVSVVSPVCWRVALHVSMADTTQACQASKRPLPADAEDTKAEDTAKKVKTGEELESAEVCTVRSETCILLAT